MDALGFDNYVEIFTALPVRDLVPQQRHRGARLDRDRAAVGDRDGLCLRPLSTPAARRSALAVLASQMLPPVILVLPLFALFLTAGLLNTHVGLIFAHLDVNLPFLAWMLVALLRGRGARSWRRRRGSRARTRFQAFLRIAVPVAAPGILAAGLLGFILSWNEFLFALILTRQGDPDAAGRALDAWRRIAGVEIALLAAATLFALLPVLVLLAVPAQIPDQGAVARRAQVRTSEATRGTGSES